MPRIPARPKPVPNPELLTPPAAAAHLTVSLSTLRKMVRAGAIPYLFIGGSLRFRRSELDAWIEAQARASGCVVNAG